MYKYNNQLKVIKHNLQSKQLDDQTTWSKKGKQGTFNVTVVAKVVQKLVS